VWTPSAALDDAPTVVRPVSPVPPSTALSPTNTAVGDDWFRDTPTPDPGRTVTVPAVPAVPASDREETVVAPPQPALYHIGGVSQSGSQPDVVYDDRPLPSRNPIKGYGDGGGGGGGRRGRRFFAFGGVLATLVVLAVIGVLVFNTLKGTTKALPALGFTPTATDTPGAAQETAVAFLTAWQKGQLAKAASYTDAPTAAQAELTAYAKNLGLTALTLTPTATTATASGAVAFTVAATVGVKGKITAPWTYTSSLTAYKKSYYWVVKWRSDMLAPNLTATTHLAVKTVAPGVGTVTDSSGTNLATYSDVSLQAINGILKKSAPSSQGTPGLDVYLADQNGTEMTSTEKVLATPVATGTLPTTINSSIQNAAQSAVQKYPNSSMAVIQPSTGDILGIANNEGGYDEALKAKLAPGSTFKTITTTALLNNGDVTLNETVPCPAQIVINGRAFHNSENEVGTNFTFANDFAQSCNNAFVGQYKDPGITLSSMANTASTYYGLNQPWDIGLGSPTTYMTVPNANGEDDLGGEMFGQSEIVASPLALASVAATVDTGTFKQPILVAGTKQTTATPLPSGVTSDLHTLMRSVITTGTAAGVFTTNDTIYGKTGTAQVNNQKDNSWMIVFDPTKDVAVAALVVGGGFGAQAAAPEINAMLKAIGA
jgi:hypothetical protein